MNIQDYAIGAGFRSAKQIAQILAILSNHKQRIYESSTWTKKPQVCFRYSQTHKSWLASQTEKNVLTAQEFINKFSPSNLPNLY